MTSMVKEVETFFNRHRITYQNNNKMEYQFKPGDIVAVIGTNTPGADGLYTVDSQHDDRVTVTANFYANDEVTRDLGALKVNTFSTNTEIIIPWSGSPADHEQLRGRINPKLRPITTGDYVFRYETNGDGWLTSLVGIDKCKKVMWHPGGDFKSIFVVNTATVIQHSDTTPPGTKIYHYKSGVIFDNGMYTSFIDHSKPYERIEIASF